MANTSSRMLQLLSLLQTHRYWPGSDLADRLEVSVRTLRRDIDRLRELGYPVQASRGVDGGYQLAVGAALPPLVLDDEEAVALTVGLLAASRSAVSGMSEASVRALAKVVPVLPTRLRRRVDALRAMTEPLGWGGDSNVDPGHLTTVALACRDTERMRFGYTARGGARTERHVEPHRLVPIGRRWYLVAYDLDRHDWRSFRLDRLVDPGGTGASFAPRKLPADDAGAFVRSGLQVSSLSVEVLIHAPADPVREKLGRWATIEDVDADSCLLRMTVDSLEWTAFALGAVGADFTVRSPPELQHLIGEWSTRFARAR